MNNPQFWIQNNLFDVPQRGGSDTCDRIELGAKMLNAPIGVGL